MSTIPNPYYDRILSSPNVLKRLENNPYNNLEYVFIMYKTLIGSLLQ